MSTDFGQYRQVDRICRCGGLERDHSRSKCLHLGYRTGITFVCDCTAFVPSGLVKERYGGLVR